MYQINNEDDGLLISLAVTCSRPKQRAVGLVLCDTWTERRYRYRLKYRDTRYHRDTGNALPNFNVFQKSP